MKPCANNCGREIEDGLEPGTCCSKKCGVELLEDIEASKSYEHESDYALEMRDQEQADFEANNEPQE